MESSYFLQIPDFCGIYRKFHKIHGVPIFGVKTTSGRNLPPGIPIIPCATTTFPAGGDFFVIFLKIQGILGI